MVINGLKMVNFRNYTQKKYEFEDRLNFLIGPNGSGKTTTLEAIHLLSISKSFKTNSLKKLVNEKEDYFQVFGEFDNDEKQKVNINYTRQEGKKILFNDQELDRNIDLIGRIPVIILSPSDQRITEGPNSLRKNFINQILSQIDNKYLSSLVEYNSLKKRRNKLLKNYKEKGKNSYDLYFQTLDEKLVKRAKYISDKRNSFLDKFNQIFQESFQKISHFDRKVAIEIKNNINLDKNYIEKYQSKLKDNFQQELDKGYTSIGVHRDKVRIYFGNNNIREVGSQGEHKIALIALKMTEGNFIEKEGSKKVIYLMDDLFSMLDYDHCIKIIKQLSQDNQIFITTTELENAHTDSLAEDSYNIIEVGGSHGN